MAAVSKEELIALLKEKKELIEQMHVGQDAVRFSEEDKTRWNELNGEVDELEDDRGDRGARGADRAAREQQAAPGRRDVPDPPAWRGHRGKHLRPVDRVAFLG